MSGNGVPKPPPTGERSDEHTMVRHPDVDARVIWDQNDEYNGAQSVSLAEQRGQLRGKYDALKQMVRYVESMRAAYELRANRYEQRATWQGYVLIGVLVAIVLLWTATSVTYGHPVPPWQMFALFNHAPPPPPPNGGPYGRP